MQLSLGWEEDASFPVLWSDAFSTSSTNWINNDARRIDNEDDWRRLREKPQRLEPMVGMNADDIRFVTVQTLHTFFHDEVD